MNIDELARRIATAKPITSLNVRDDSWPEVDCDGAVFTDCVFEAVQFSYPSFVDARFSNCRFVSCRLSHAALKDAVFETCQFTDDGGKGCTFAFSDLQRVRFSGCDLALATFERTEMFAVEMHECNLTGARFNKVDFSRALSRKQIETRASFHNCKMDLADLAETKLPTCSLAGSRLREADLSSADLTDADLTNCDLFQANLHGATLAGADLAGAEVSGLNLLTPVDFKGVRVTDEQVYQLLDAMGVDVRTRQR